MLNSVKIIPADQSKCAIYEKIGGGGGGGGRGWSLHNVVFIYSLHHDSVLLRDLPPPDPWRLQCVFVETVHLWKVFPYCWLHI